MTFLDAHDCPVDLVLRVLGIPASMYYDWRAAGRVGPPGVGRCRVAGADRPRSVPRTSSLTPMPPAGMAGTASPGAAGRPQKHGAGVMREHGLAGAFVRKRWKSLEGMGSYGKGLARHLLEVGVEVVKVHRPDRSDHRRRGKSDTFDAFVFVASFPPSQ